MLFFHGKEAQNQAKEHKGLILFSSANTSACGQWKHAPIFVFLVDRMRQNRYNTPRMPHQYGTIFINCGPRGAFSARRRVSAAPPQGGAAGKIFSGGKTKWLLLAPTSPRSSSAPRSTASARECPLPTAARFLPVVVHAAAPVSPTKSGSNLRIVCYR